jgi:hypothetical protein
VDEAALRDVVATYARLRAAYGEVVGEAVLVQPTGDFFPDAFSPEPRAIARLLSRMISYAPLASDLPVELAFTGADEEQGHAGGCGSAGCGVRAGGHAAGGAVEDHDDRYRVSVPVSDVSHPVLLTTALARAVGSLVLLEGGDDDVSPATAELCATMCGLGVLLAAGSAVWAKSCGGLTGMQATALGVDETAAALALFVAVHGVSASEARRHLETTQREAFDDASCWVESNPLLVETLRDRPALLEGGAFDLEPARGIVGRWLHKRRLERDLRQPASSPRPALTDAQRRRIEEAKALVEEVLGES